MTKTETIIERVKALPDGDNVWFGDYYDGQSFNPDGATITTNDLKKLVSDLETLRGRNGYQQIWHQGSNHTIRPYPEGACSNCRPGSGREFNPLEEFTERAIREQKLVEALHHQHMRLIAICPDTVAENPSLFKLIGSMKDEIKEALDKIAAPAQGEGGKHDDRS